MTDEYIRKQEAIDIVVFECGKWTGLAKEISKQLKQLSAANVVSVVRCRDCKHVRKWRSEESAKKFGQVYECALGVLACPNPNDFCSYGERKSES